MANLKLIKVTGSPFCSTLYGCIGIQVDGTNFKVIKGGELNHQVSSNGFGWEYATDEEIAENWKLIYPHWKPEPGDDVIITQDYDDWANQKGTIYEKGSSKDYWQVKRKEGNVQSFDYTCQMILAPTTSTTSSIVTETEISKPEEKPMHKFKIGDRVKCINPALRGSGKTGTVHVKSSDTSDTSVGVEFDEDIDGHALDGRCRMNHGWWVFEKDLELAPDSRPKEEIVNIRFLTEQEFKDQGLWSSTHPKGWNSDGLMNKYLGQSRAIPKSIIRSGGDFRYDDWTFKVTDYLITTESSIDSKLEPRFKVGDKVTYKSTADCGGSYAFGGVSRKGRIGEVEAYIHYQPEQECYKITVSSGNDSDCSYSMLESEFEEFDSSYSGRIHVPEYSTSSVLTIPTGNTTFGTFGTGSTPSDPLDAYHQNPITIKKKPKTKLTITTI